MAARRAAAPRRSAARSKPRQPIFEPREHSYILGALVSGVAAGVGLCAFWEPGPAGAAAHSGLLHGGGLMGSLLVTAGLGWTGAQLFRSHTPSAARGTAWGCLLAVLGGLGLLGLVGWGGAIGDSTAGIFAPHIAWLSVLPLAGVAALGAWLAGFRREAWLAVSHPRAAVQAARATITERVATLTAGGVAGWLVGRWRRLRGGDDVVPGTTEAPTSVGKPAIPQSRNRSGYTPEWLTGAIDEAMSNPPTPGAAAPAPLDRISQGMFPLDADDPEHATVDEAGDGSSGLILLPSVAVAERPAARRRAMQTPDIRILDDAPVDTGKMRNRDCELGELLVRSLELLKAPATILEINSGPSVTQYVLRAEPGVTARKYAGTQTDLALALGSAVRVQAPIPGQAAIGIEVAHAERQVITLRSILQSPEFVRIAQRSHVALGIGADTSGRPVIADLARMPHLLIGGTTGSGKSTLLRALMASLLLQASPAQVRLVMIDPKRVEFTPYSRRGGLPHLWLPVVTEAAEAVEALTALVAEMERRYRLLASAGVEDLEGYNVVASEPLPRLALVIDEIADLMLVIGKEIEDLLCRLGGMGRAAGIHLVVATQSPRSDVITGLLKANLPSAIGLRVTSVTESRIVLNEKGAETLSGPGDLLLKLMDDGKTRRLQGALITSREMERVLTHWTG